MGAGSCIEDAGAGFLAAFPSLMGRAAVLSGIAEIPPQPHSHRVIETRRTECLNVCISLLHLEVVGICDVY